jgi:hypothetical protein
MTTPVDFKRYDLTIARDALVLALYNFEVASAALKQAQREDDATDEQTAFEAAQTAFVQARQDQADAITLLQTALEAWLPDGTTPEDEYAKASATAPIVLFPVRLETRFADGYLKVRIMPDEIMLNMHERALTKEEQDRAKAYYEAVVENGREGERWRDMVARFGAQRAAYVLREMLPTFGVPGGGSSSSSAPSVNYCEGEIPAKSKDPLTFPTDVQSRVSSWTRPGEAVLPDRFIVYVYKNGVRRDPPTLGARVLEPLQITPDPKLTTAELDAIGDFPIDPNLRWSLDFDRACDVGMGVRVPLVDDDATAGFSRVLVLGVKSSMGPFETSQHIERLLDAHHYTAGLA